MTNKLTEALADLDPLHLVKIGAPRDEYSGEALEIETIHRRYPTEDLARICRRVFVKAFDEDIVKHVDFDTVAEKLRPLL